jgi:hypothetical protein
MDRVGALVAAGGLALLATGPLGSSPLIGTGFGPTALLSHLGLFYVGYGLILAVSGIHTPRRAAAAGTVVLAAILPLSVVARLRQLVTDATVASVLPGQFLLVVAILPAAAGLPLGQYWQDRPGTAVVALGAAAVCWLLLVFPLATVVGIAGNGLFLPVLLLLAAGGVVGAVPLFLLGMYQPRVRGVLGGVPDAA